jgi:hypothetical protein
MYVSSQVSALGSLKAWYETWADPVVRAMYAADRPAAQQALSAARARLEHETALSGDQRQALAFQLHYLQYRMERALGAPDAAVRFQETLAAISAAASGPTAQAMQCKLLLMLRASGERSGYGELPAADFAELMNGVPENDRDQEFWYYVASWAFAKRNEEYLSLAYEDFLTHSHEMLSESMFRRVNLMYLLVQRRAMRQDVAELIHQSKLPAQLVEIRRHMWPVCQEQGLIDDTLELQLTAKEAALSAAGGGMDPLQKQQHVEL